MSVNVHPATALVLSLAFFVASACRDARSTASESTELSSGEVTIFLVALDDNGSSGQKIGCNDSIVPVTRTIASSDTSVRGALTELFALRDRPYGQSGLHNALAESRLSVDSVRSAGDTLEVRLSGTVSLAGACDAPRVQAQIEQTALRAINLSRASVYLNDRPLAEVLSGQGR
jgi:hypothetical protein